MDKTAFKVTQAPPPILSHDGPALIIQHCAVFGRLETRVRWFSVSLGPYAQYATAASVSFKEPRKKRGANCTVLPENVRYLTIEAEGCVLYDSRWNVPCDMAKWEETARRFPTPAFVSVKV